MILIGIEQCGCVKRIHFFTHPRRLRGDPSLTGERGVIRADKRLCTGTSLSMPIARKARGVSMTAAGKTRRSDLTVQF